MDGASFDAMICARFSYKMQNDYYVLAHEQAANERKALRAQIEKLLARDVKLEQLLDCLKEFLPVTEGAPAEHQHAAEALAHEHHGESHEHAHASA
jgi:hypothetical protein